MSGRQDLNLRPPGPKPGALATAPHPEYNNNTIKLSLSQGSL